MSASQAIGGSGCSSPASEVDEEAAPDNFLDEHDPVHDDDDRLFEDDVVITSEDAPPLPPIHGGGFQQALAGDIDATAIAAMYVRKLHAVDANTEPLRSPAVNRRGAGGVGGGRSALAKGGAGGGSKPRLGTAPGKSKAARPTTATSATALDEPLGSFTADVRCATRVGPSVWTAERDGCLVVRCAATSKVLERVVPHGWEAILCMTAVGTKVWCGTESGPILLFDKASRRLTSEARHHSGCVHVVACSAPSAGGKGFVVSGGADWRVVMWSMEGTLIKVFPGHTGCVRTLIVLGMTLWSGADDGCIRVWDAAFGLFDLETKPCVAQLTGHSGAVHHLLPHTEGVLSCAADGTVRCWQPGGGRECIREVRLPCGPVYSLVPMGKCIWAAGADGVLHALDGSTLEPSGKPRAGHGGFVSGLCSLPARTTRQCWSFSTSDGRVCRWKSEEIESQQTAEAAARLQCERDTLSEHMQRELIARAAEQKVHAADKAADASTIAAHEAALRDASGAQATLLGELGKVMEDAERDVRENERLTALLAERDAQLSQALAEGAAREAAASEALQVSESRAATAEAEAMARADECENQQARIASMSDELRRQNTVTVRLALKCLSMTVRERREGMRAAAARRAEERRRRCEEEAAASLLQAGSLPSSPGLAAAQTRATDVWGGVDYGATAVDPGSTPSGWLGGHANGEAEGYSAAAAAGGGEDHSGGAPSMVSTGTSLEEMMSIGGVESSHSSD